MEFKDSSDKWFAYGIMAAFLLSFANPALGGTVALIVIGIGVLIVFSGPSKPKKRE